MIYLISSIGLGIAMGIFSIRYQKAFLMMFLPAIPILILISRNVAAFFNKFPKEAQETFILFPVAFIISRLLSWIVSKFIKPKTETPAARKKRILKEYGYEDGQLPY